VVCTFTLHACLGMCAVPVLRVGWKAGCLADHQHGRATVSIDSIEEHASSPEDASIVMDEQKELSGVGGGSWNLTKGKRSGSRGKCMQGTARMHFLSFHLGTVMWRGAGGCGCAGQASFGHWHCQCQSTVTGNCTMAP
jgi:hypothetical protein